MKQFTDDAGTTWNVSVTVSSIKRVRDVLNVDILDTVNGGLTDKLIDDPILLCDVLYVLCSQQAEKDGVSDEQFGERMAGDVIERATSAFLEALVEFFPLAKRRVLEASIQKNELATKKLLENAEALIASKELDELLEQKIKGRMEELRKTLGD